MSMRQGNRTNRASIIASMGLPTRDEPADPISPPSWSRPASETGTTRRSVSRTQSRALATAQRREAASQPSSPQATRATRQRSASRDRDGAPDSFLHNSEPSEPPSPVNTRKPRVQEVPEIQPPPAETKKSKKKAAKEAAAVAAPTPAPVAAPAATPKVFPQPPPARRPTVKKSNSQGGLAKRLSSLLGRSSSSKAPAQQPTVPAASTSRDIPESLPSPATSLPLEKHDDSEDEAEERFTAPPQHSRPQRTYSAPPVRGDPVDYGYPDDVNKRLSSQAGVFGLLRRGTTIKKPSEEPDTRMKRYSYQKTPSTVSAHMTDLRLEDDNESDFQGGEQDGDDYYGDSRQRSSRARPLGIGRMTLAEARANRYQDMEDLMEEEGEEDAVAIRPVAKKASKKDLRKRRASQSGTAKPPVKTGRQRSVPVPDADDDTVMAGEYEDALTTAGTAVPQQRIQLQDVARGRAEPPDVYDDEDIAPVLSDKRVATVGKGIKPKASRGRAVDEEQVPPYDEDMAQSAPSPKAEKSAGGAVAGLATAAGAGMLAAFGSVWGRGNGNGAEKTQDTSNMPAVGADSGMSTTGATDLDELPGTFGAKPSRRAPVFERSLPEEAEADNTVDSTRAEAAMTPWKTPRGRKYVDAAPMEIDEDGASTPLAEPVVVKKPKTKKSKKGMNKTLETFEEPVAMLSPTEEASIASTPVPVKAKKSKKSKKLAVEDVPPIVDAVEPVQEPEIEEPLAEPVKTKKKKKLKRKSVPVLEASALEPEPEPEIVEDRAMDPMPSAVSVAAGLPGAVQSPISPTFDREDFQDLPDETPFMENPDDGRYQYFADNYSAVLDDQGQAMAIPVSSKSKKGKLVDGEKDVKKKKRKSDAKAAEVLPIAEAPLSPSTEPEAELAPEPAPVPMMERQESSSRFSNPPEKPAKSKLRKPSISRQPETEPTTITSKAKEALAAVGIISAGTAGVSALKYDDEPAILSDPEEEIVASPVAKPATMTTPAAATQADATRAAASAPQSGPRKVRRLNAVQRHYLVKALVCLQMQSEFEELEKLGALTQYGFPFSKERPQLTRIKKDLQNEYTTGDDVEAEADDPYADDQDETRRLENLQEPLILRHLFHRHVRVFPGLDTAPLRWWQKRVQVFFDEMAARNFSTSLERGEYSKRRFYTLAATRYVGSYFARGIGMRGDGEMRGPGPGDAGSERWGVGKNWGKGTVKRGLARPARIDPQLWERIDGLFGDEEEGRIWRKAGKESQRTRGDWNAWKEQIIENETGLEDTIDFLDISKIRNLPTKYRNAEEWARNFAAYLLHSLFVSTPQAESTFAAVKGIHTLFPYWGAKQLLKYTNAQTLIEGILNLLLARPAGAKSLIQRIASYVIGSEATSLQKEYINPLKKAIDDERLSSRIEDYVSRGSRPEGRSIRSRAEKTGDDVLTVILLSAAGTPLKRDVQDKVVKMQHAFAASPYRGNIEAAYPAITPFAKENPERMEVKSWGASRTEEDEARQFAQLKLYLRDLLKKRDREEAIKVAGGALIPTIVKDLLSIVLYDSIKKIANAADLSSRLGDLQAFLEDLIEVKKRKDDSIQAWIALAARHENSLYYLVHECAGISGPLFEWSQIGLDYMALSTSDPLHPADRNARNIEMNVEKLLEDGRMNDKDVDLILEEVDELATYTKWSKVAYELQMRQNFLLSRPDAATTSKLTEADVPTDEMKEEIRDLNSLMKELMEVEGVPIDDGTLPNESRGTEARDLAAFWFDTMDPLGQHLTAEKDVPDLSFEPITVTPPIPCLKYIRKALPAFQDVLRECLPDWANGDKHGPAARAPVAGAGAGAAVGAGAGAGAATAASKGKGKNGKVVVRSPASAVETKTNAKGKGKAV